MIIYLLAVPMAIISFVLAFVIYGIILQLYRLVKFERSLDQTMGEIRPCEKMDSFSIGNPYAGRGRYWKGQLHIHTREYSRDAAMNMEEAMLRYREKGYDFLSITDHNHLALRKDSEQPVLIIPGTEDTYPWRLLGHHFLRININRQTGGGLAKRFADTYEDGGVIALAHPSWRGGLGFGRWLPHDIPKSESPLFIEIYSYYSNSTQEDINLWHYLLNAGRYPAVWAIASDDMHNRSHLGRSWIMVKSEQLTAEAIVDSLKKGCFYASTGPEAEFGLDGEVIFARTGKESTIRFINGQNRVVAAGFARELSYTPRGNERFIRMEVEDDAGGRAWSQPFFLAAI